MSKPNHLSGAIRFALLAGASCLVAGNVMAQEAAADDMSKVLDQITVTGTRIKSQTITSSAPVAEIDREEFQFSGATRVDDLVNQYPQMNAFFDSFANNPSVGYPTVDLRALGTQRSLPLVNGRRLPPGDVLGAVDISVIPAALVSRVDILTGGASAVYGSDAMAGVVNFILDTEFEGFSATLGYSGYEHDNDNEYIQGLMDARNFGYPEGSKFGGQSKNIDLAWGSSFADGAGHAMAWVTWRENDPLFQGERDYSSCALSASGGSCGGSGTAAAPNFLVYQYSLDGSSFLGGGPAHLNADGSWAGGFGELYNFAPINYFQRPEERRTFGTSLKYEINDMFRPYMEAMYVDRRNSTQIAESGTFFGQRLDLDCSDPLIGTLCNDLGLDLNEGPAVVYVGKRNTEGGPRFTGASNDAYRFVTGVEGDINDSWSYDVSYLYGHNSAVNTGRNDFLSDRVGEALLGCPAGSFGGCLPYNVWVPGGVTAAAANALAGVSLTNINTDQSVFNGFVTGDLGFSLPSASDNISLVAGYEWRKDTFSRSVDTNTAEGNFTGAGGPTQAISGQIEVSEVFFESQIPLVQDAGMLDALSLDLGYRYSDYETSGGANTYKLGFGADIGDYRIRGGYNRAIRAPNVGNLFLAQQFNLWSGDDPCSGATPELSAAQCANTGVSAAQYGNISASPAGQYNQITGGNPNLDPEQGDTYTFGLVATPIEDLQLSIDYYDIKIEDAISTVGASTILSFCAQTGDPFLCDRVQRSGTGDLWRGNDPNTSGHIINLTDNFGELHFRGIDFGANYRWEMLGGRAMVSMQGTRTLEQEQNPLPGVNDEAIFDCVGVINPDCSSGTAVSPEWRAITNARFSRDWYTVNLRWRYFGSVDYTLVNGNPGAADALLVANGGGIGSYNYFDLSGSVFIGDNVEVTLGINNIADKEPPMVGSTVALNGNSPGGYDQAGRYVFGSVGFTF